MTQDPKPLNRVEEWIAMRANKILLVFALLIVVGAGAVVFLLVDEQKRLSGVSRAGPCRSQGIEDPECREQARLIFKACSDQPQRCARMYGIAVMPWIDHEKKHHGDPSSTFPSSAVIEPEGGDAFQPSTGRQQPGPGKGPRSGGNGDQGHGEGAAPAPSPGASGPPAPVGGSPGETPGKGPGGASGGGSSSGADVEVCVASRCVEAEVDLNLPKGPIP